MKIELDFDKLEIISKKFEIELLILFGSYAKKTNNSNSDIDLAYLSNKKINEKELFFELSKILKTENIDLTEISEYNSIEINWNIFKDGIKIYEKTKGTFENYLNKYFIDYVDFQENIKIKNEILNKKLHNINTTNFKQKLSI